MRTTTRGWKLLRAGGFSLNHEFRYEPGKWVTVPGNGAYVAVTGGLLTGGNGPVLARVEAREPTGADAPEGVQCFRRVRVTLLTDPAALAAVARTDADVTVRWAATIRITDPAVLAEIARTDVDVTVRWAATERITDPAVLAEIARTDADIDVRRLAGRRHAVGDTVVRPYNGCSVVERRRARCARA